MKQKLFYIASGSVITGALLVSGTVFAAGSGTGTIASGRTNRTSDLFPNERQLHKPAVIGEVTAVNQNAVTLAVKHFKDNTVMTYTINIAGASIMKAERGQKPQEVSASDIKVGDILAVRGAMGGTSVSASAVFDGKLPPGHRKGFNHGRGSLPGAVTTINGATLTVVHTDRKTNTQTIYTVDASNAKVVYNKTHGSLSDIKVGDKVLVMSEPQSYGSTTLTALIIYDKTK